MELTRWRPALAALLETLQKKRVTHLYICGLGLDTAVAYTALHAVEAGYAVSVVEDACRGAIPEAIASMKEKMTRAGIAFVNSAAIDACPTSGARRPSLAPVAARRPALRRPAPPFAAPPFAAPPFFAACPRDAQCCCGSTAIRCTPIMRRIAAARTCLYSPASSLL